MGHARIGVSWAELLAALPLQPGRLYPVCRPSAGHDSQARCYRPATARPAGQRRGHLALLAAAGPAYRLRPAGGAPHRDTDDHDRGRGARLSPDRERLAGRQPEPVDRPSGCSLRGQSVAGPIAIAAIGAADTGYSRPGHGVHRLGLAGVPDGRGHCADRLLLDAGRAALRQVAGLAPAQRQSREHSGAYGGHRNQSQRLHRRAGRADAGRGRHGAGRLHGHWLTLRPCPGACGRSNGSRSPRRAAAGGCAGWLGRPVSGAGQAGVGGRRDVDYPAVGEQPARAARHAQSGRRQSLRIAAGDIRL